MFLTHGWDPNNITTLSHSGPLNNGNKGVLHIPQNWSLTTRYSLESYSRYTSGSSTDRADSSRENMLFLIEAILNDRLLYIVSSKVNLKQLYNEYIECEYIIYDI